MSSRPLLQMLVGMLYAIGRADAQQPIESLLKIYDSKVPQEKIYIHFDNSLYTQGQTVWYKAYVLKGNDPSDLSKNLYIDWFDEKGKFIDRVIAPIVGSTASGSFTVPKKYPGAQLQVLAYTKWMLNFDSAFLFHKNIPVVQTTAQSNTSSVAPVTTLRFFPEGGDMIENISSTIAFKAQKQGGLPADVSGIVADKNGKQVASFMSVHKGMGKFSFTPVSGETYTAEWTDAKGNKQSTVLPAAKREGLLLSINSNPLNTGFSIERTVNAAERFTKATIIAQMNRRVVFRAGVDLSSKTKLSSSIPTTNLPSGILQVTVFDAMHQPMAERIVFVNNDNYLLPVNLQTDTVNLAKHGKNVYNITVPGVITTSLSLSVTDGDTNRDSSNSIISQFLLSGDVKGYVHEPAWYFSSTADSIADFLDLVLLTNGWRRFNWDDVWSGKTPSLPYAADTNYLSITGRIDSLTAKQVQKAGTINMILVGKNSGSKFIFTPLNNDGSFQEKDLVLFDTTKIFYKPNNISLPEHSRVSIRNSFLPLDRNKKMQELALLPPDTTSAPGSASALISHEQWLLDSLKNKTTLEEVTVTAKFKTRFDQLDEQYATGQFSGHSTTIYEYDLVDDPAGRTPANIFNYLRDKVPSFQVSPPQMGARRIVFLLNETRVLGMNDLYTLAVSEVAYVKAFPSFGVGGKNAPAFIVIYTKDGKDINKGPGEMSYTLIGGYTPVKEFYLPQNDELPVNAQADLQRTLYWKPNILTTGNSNKVKIIFSNNDVSHSLRIVLEGFAADGRFIHLTKLLK
ncbi:MAG: hypothetical protein V4539_00540 [Bacteroidota bacterium]